MNKLLGTSLAALACAALLVSAAGAQEAALPHRTIGPGFHTSSAPLGGRWWVSNDVGFDLGLGVSIQRVSALVDLNDDGTIDTQVNDNLTGWAVDFGVPWAFWRWEGVRGIIRPGIGYLSEDDLGTFFAVGERVKLNTFRASAELEVECFIARNVSISASHGFQYSNAKLDTPGSISEWTFESTGTGFTNLGFHLYLFGPEVK